MPEGDKDAGRYPQENGNAAAIFEFNRRESPTQSAADAILQGHSMEIWGGPARGSSIPSVKAYRESKHALAGNRGVMFDTMVRPTSGSGTPFEARWYDGTIGVMQRPQGFVAISITGFRNLQP